MRPATSEPSSLRIEPSGGGCVGAAQQDGTIGEVLARGPLVLAVADGVVAVVDGAGPEAGEVRHGTRRGVAVAADLRGAEDLRQMLGFLLLVAPLNERRA